MFLALHFGKHVDVNKKPKPPKRFILIQSNVQPGKDRQTPAVRLDCQDAFWDKPVRPGVINLLKLTATSSVLINTKCYEFDTDFPDKEVQSK